MKKSSATYYILIGLVLAGALLIAYIFFEKGTVQPSAEPSSVEPSFVEPTYDYRFQDGDYALYCRALPYNPFSEEGWNSYDFSLYRGNEQIGDALTFRSDGSTTFNYDMWWERGIVDGVLTGTAATVHVGWFEVELDFDTNQLHWTRVYKKEMLGDLLVSNQAGDKQIYTIHYDETLMPTDTFPLTYDIVLYDANTDQIYYVFNSFSLNQVLFDHQNNILACSAGGVSCIDGDTYQRKALPFKFPHEPGNYVFVDFLYDSANEIYILAWAEPSEWLEMIPEETATLEGVPNMQVSIFSADGSLLIEYDTQHIIPPWKVFDPHWPRLKLDGTGLELAGGFTDGRKRTFLSVPLADYLEIFS